MNDKKFVPETEKRIAAIVEKHLRYYDKNMAEPRSDVQPPRRRGRVQRVKYRGREFDIFHNAVGDWVSEVAGRGLPVYRICHGTLSVSPIDC